MCKNSQEQLLREVLKKYIDYVSLTEGDFYMDVPDFTEEEHLQFEELVNEIIMENIEEEF